MGEIRPPIHPQISPELRNAYYNKPFGIEIQIRRMSS